MSLLSLLILLVAIGVIMWAINRYVPMEPNWKNLINIVVIVVVVLWLLSVFGILPALNQIRVGP